MAANRSRWRKLASTLRAFAQRPGFRLLVAVADGEIAGTLCAADHGEVSASAAHPPVSWRTSRYCQWRQGQELVAP